MAAVDTTALQLLGKYVSFNYEDNSYLGVIDSVVFQINGDVEIGLGHEFYFYSKFSNLKILGSVQLN